MIIWLWKNLYCIYLIFQHLNVHHTHIFHQRIIVSFLKIIKHIFVINLKFYFSEQSESENNSKRQFLWINLIAKTLIKKIILLWLTTLFLSSLKNVRSINKHIQVFSPTNKYVQVICPTDKYAQAICPANNHVEIVCPINKNVQVMC